MARLQSVEAKRQREKRMVQEMVALYCRKKHGGQKRLCPNCRVHCYRPDMREKIRAVMRWAGPRMLLHHPVAAARHVIETKREKKKLEAAE